MYEWSTEKHVSQTRQRSASSPVRSVSSSTAEQKHVGQTIVQLPQVRQRSATSSQRGCSRLLASRSRRSSASIVPPHPLAPRRSTDAAAALEVGLDRGARRQLGEHLGAALACPASTRKPVLAVEDLGQREVVARPRPSGPVPIETQKHVPPGSKQFTATTNAPSRRAA